MYDYLEQKAKNNNLEVEDLVNLAVNREVNSVPFLRDAINKYEWDDYMESTQSNRVPLATWASIVIAYLESGFSGFQPFIQDSNGKYLETSYFVASVLDDIKTEECVINTMSLYKDLIKDPSLDLSLAKKLVSVFNRLLSLPPYVLVDDEIKKSIREFLHKCLNIQGNDDRANIFCALRGVGDSESIKLIKSYPKLSGAWSGVENIVIKAIRGQ